MGEGKNNNNTTGLPRPCRPLIVRFGIMPPPPVGWRDPRMFTLSFTTEARSQIKAAEGKVG